MAFLLFLVLSPEMAGVERGIEVGDESMAFGRVSGNGSGRCSVGSDSLAGSGQLFFSRNFFVSQGGRAFGVTDIIVLHNELEMVDDFLSEIKGLVSSRASSCVFVNRLEQADEGVLSLFDGVNAIEVFVAISNKLCDFVLDIFIDPLVYKGDRVENPVELILLEILASCGIKVTEDDHELVVSRDSEARGTVVKLHSSLVEDFTSTSLVSASGSG